MQAILYDRYGPPSVLSCKDIDKPAPAPGEVLVRVCAASVNPYDWHFLRGAPGFVRLFTGLRKPRSPRLGADCAGIVEAVAPGVTRFHPGDPVFGTCRGSFAEFACGKETQFARKPDNVGFLQAAAVPIAGITALQALRDQARLHPGQSILINGAGGGVGTFAVQIARNMGARITGVCGAANADLVRSLGAEHVIDYTKEDFARLGKTYDVLFDLVGNRTLSDCLRVLTPKGVFVGCGAGGPDKRSSDLLAPMLGRRLRAPFSTRRIVGVLARMRGADLEELGRMMASGALVPVLDRTYKLADVAEAIAYVERGHTHGKVAIAVP